MASTLNSARHEFSEDRLWPTEPSVGSADERSRPPTYEFGSGMGKTGKLSEIKLLAELENSRDGHLTRTTSESRPLSTIKLTGSDAEIRAVASNNKQASLRKRTARGLACVLIILSMGVAATFAWQSYGNATKKMIASSYPQLGWLPPETVAAQTTPEITSSIAPATTSDPQEKTVAAETIPEKTSPIAPPTSSESQEKTAAVETIPETTSQTVPAATSESQEKTVAAKTIPERTSSIAPPTTSASQEIKAILMTLGAVRQSVDHLTARQQQMANDIARLKAAEQNILRKINSAPSDRPTTAPARKRVPVAPRAPQEPPMH